MSRSEFDVRRLGRLAPLMLLLAAAASWLHAQEATDPAAALDAKLIAAAQAKSEIMANLSYLSDEIGHRLTGSASLKRANEWAAEKMKSYGLENVHLEAWEIPVAWERGTAYARILEPDNGRTIHLAARGWSPSTKGKVEGEVVIVRARTPEELKAYKGKLKNAIVLQGAPATVRPISDLAYSPGERPTPTGSAPGRNRADRGGARPDGSAPAAATPAVSAPASPAPTGPKPTSSAPNGSAPAATRAGERPEGFDNRPGRSGFMAFRREMNEFMRAEGVAAILTDSGKPHGLLNMTGNWAQGEDRVAAPEPIPQAFVTHDHYALLYRLASRPAPAKTRMEIELTNKLIPGPHAVYNTVGEIRGSEKPDEFVVVGAHLDSWDLGQGTTDNGTGTCVVLETARLLATCGVKPKRTIRFVLFSGEEQGLHGSRAYVRQHKDEMARTSAALVHDTGTGRVTSFCLQGREKLKPILEKEFKALTELGVKEISTRSMGGSDHQSFETAGTPGFMFQQDPAEYRLTHHSQSDTLDKAREPDLIQGAQVMSVAAMRIANLGELLPREKK